MRKIIQIPHPDWDSNLLRVILELETLRRPRLYSDVPPYIFFQLKNIFQILETLGSARIEGNNTTLSEYVEKIIEKNTSQDEKRQELENLERAICFIEENTNSQTIFNRAYFSEVHKIVVDGLSREGSVCPGELRSHNVQIQKSKHVPSLVEVLQEHFDEFLRFINSEQSAQNQLLMVAIAHHRFMYIHPFDNGNGRVGRLLNYALLIKLGFNVQAGRILNPSSVFYTDRDKYYEMLAKADQLDPKNLLDWSEYFLNGLNNQMQKINSLMDSDFTRNQILLPALKNALERQHITKQEYDILSYIIKNDAMAIKAADLDKIGIKATAQKTYAMSKLRDKGMVDSITKGGRIYTIKFVNNYLLRGVIQALENQGFVAEFLNKNS